MPERFPIQPPTANNAKQNVIAGTNTFSGTPNTGQVLFSDGGSMTDSQHSGAPGDLNLWVGAGRLDSVGQLAFAAGIVAASGFPIYFYDSAVIVSGGPTANSGLNVLAVLDPRSYSQNALGGTGFWNSARIAFTQVPFNPRAVFTSGLCVHTRSGQTGFVAAWTPVVSN